MNRRSFLARLGGLVGAALIGASVIKPDHATELEMETWVVAELELAWGHGWEPPDGQEVEYKISSFTEQPVHMIRPKDVPDVITVYDSDCDPIVLHDWQRRPLKRREGSRLLLDVGQLKRWWLGDR